MSFPNISDTWVRTVTYFLPFCRPFFSRHLPSYTNTFFLAENVCPWLKLLPTCTVAPRSSNGTDVSKYFPGPYAKFRRCWVSFYHLSSFSAAPYFIKTFFFVKQLTWLHQLHRKQNENSVYYPMQIIYKRIKARIWLYDVCQEASNLHTLVTLTDYQTLYWNYDYIRKGSQPRIKSSVFGFQLQPIELRLRQSSYGSGGMACRVTASAKWRNWTNRCRYESAENTHNKAIVQARL